MARTPTGFEFQAVGSDVVITHHRRRATTLRGAAATRFLSEVEHSDAQELMARVTGNYKHGNERAGKDHPRNKQH